VDAKSRVTARNADAEGHCPTPDPVFRCRRSHAGSCHEIGKQFADEWLKGKYEYVIATHIDKGHCHNHIIFNAVNFVDYHAYRSNKRTYREMRQLSDEICKEHGLSVIPPSQNKGMDYKEYTEAKRGTSWKQKLKQTIDRLSSQRRTTMSF
jgi:hypothetical protein